MSLVDLRYTPEEIKERTTEQKAEMASMPDTPWGLRVSLSEREMAKLGVNGKEFKVGQEITAQVKFKITACSCRQDEYDKEMRSNADLVIVAMSPIEDNKDARAKAADTMYDNPKS